MPQAIIVGSGFAGTVLALCLKKHNIHCVVYETQSQDYQQGGCIALAPNALRVLDHIGIYNQIRTKGFNYEQKIYHFPALRIHRATVKDALIRELGRQDIPIHYNKKCSGIVEETEQSASVIFEDGEKATADFVVGADGIHSRIRPYIAAQSTPSYNGLMGINGKVMANQLSDGVKSQSLKLPCMLFGDTGFFTIMPANFSGDELSFFVSVESSDLGREGWSKLQADKDELHAMLKDRFLGEHSQYPAIVKELGEKTAKSTRASWPFFAVPHLDSWSSPKKGVLVIGDSAHAIPPTSGQGAAMAFEDAETLGYALARIYAPDFPSSPPVQGDIDAVIGSWEKHRISHIVEIVNFTNRNAALRKTSTHFYQKAAKEWLIWGVLKMIGPEGGAHSMYSYNPESVMGCFP